MESHRSAEPFGNGRPRVVDPLLRVPPQNQEAEQNVLGAMMLSGDACVRVLEILKDAEVFYRQSHRTIFDTIKDLAERAEPVDLVTVSNHLERVGKLEEVGGRLHVADIFNAVATPANAEYYARIVRDKATRRSLINVGAEVCELGYEVEQEVEVLLDAAERKVFELSQRRTTNEVQHIEPVLHAVFEQAETRAAFSGNVVGTQTGFYDLDNLLAGFQPGNLIILGARPSMGKTAFGLTLARNAAAGKPDCPGKPVVVFSLEMSREELGGRLLCGEARVNSQRLKTGYLTDDDWPRLLQAIGRLQDWPIYIDDTAAISVMEVRSKCRKLMSEVGTVMGMVVVDYLQLMESHSGGKNRAIDSRAMEVSYISRSLKALARELRAPVLALSQLSRASEQSRDKKPMLSHLRESGSIEQDADVVMFIHRDEYYNENSDFKNQAEIIIAKNRNGPTGSINLYFHKEFTLFDNLYQKAAQN